jgi:hypothetical protein
MNIRKIDQGGHQIRIDFERLAIPAGRRVMTRLVQIERRPLQKIFFRER